jgi:predicted acylesterase/phospholipase RssA
MNIDGGPRHVHIRSALFEMTLRQYSMAVRLFRNLLPTVQIGSSARHWMLHRIGFDSSFVDRITADTPSVLRSIYLDGGVLDGSHVRDEIDRLITQSARRVSGQSVRNITFRQQHEIFASDVRLSATNLSTSTSTSTSMYLSRDTTPDLALADAVRMCIALPFVLKPVYLAPEAARRAGATRDYAGLWIDGGVLNNAAAYAFDAGRAQLDPGTLVLRLAPDRTRAVIEPVDEQPVARFLARSILELLSSATANPPALSDQHPQAITLHADGLGTHRFEPDAVRLRAAQDRAYDGVMARFGRAGTRGSDL